MPFSGSTARTDRGGDDPSFTKRPKGGPETEMGAQVLELTSGGGDSNRAAARCRRAGREPVSTAAHGLPLLFRGRPRWPERPRKSRENPARSETFHFAG